MKKISRNLWLKLAAFIVCSVMAAGLVVTTLVAVYTNNYESTAQLRDEIHANIAGAYSRWCTIMNPVMTRHFRR